MTNFVQFFSGFERETMSSLLRNQLDHFINLSILNHTGRFNCSVYAKYYFDLRSLADANDISFPTEQLNVEKAQKLVSNPSEDANISGPTQ